MSYVEIEGCQIDFYYNMGNDLSYVILIYVHTCVYVIYCEMEIPCDTKCMFFSHEGKERSRKHSDDSVKMYTILCV